ncbi:hypothetical protein KY289_036698 [Solanum tuberosum]|nr:hypothetical protein KY289_036698 [Solanum tuberosum]
MMHLRDQDSPHPLLEIVGDDQQNPNAKVLLLEVQPPAIGVFALATSMKVPLLKSTIYHDAASSKSSHSDGSFNNWRVPSSNFGNDCYTPGYWEWVEDVLPCHKEILELIKVYDAVYTSLFTYDYDDNVLHAFCELWHPSTNTLSTFIGEMSISLWDLQAIGGLPVQGHFYDEVVPSAKELTQMDAQKELLLPQSCRYLFSAFYRLAKDDLQETDEENAPFVELDVEESLRDETNLTTFFACWLCKFVLPNKKVNHVSASVFKVASLMAHGKKFSLADNAHRLHHLAMLQGRDLHVTDNGKLSNSWNEYIISLRSGYVTLRHDSNFIVESYSPIRFSRQFSFCQDISKDLMERPYDEGAPLMTREYVDWWPTQRMNTSQGNLRIILKKTKQDSTSISSKGASDQSKEKPHPSSKSQVKSNDTLRLTLASKATSLAPEVGHGSSGTNELHVSSDNGNDQRQTLRRVVMKFLICMLHRMLDLQELYGGDLNNGAVADFIVDLNGLDAAAKDSHSSINNAMPSLEVVPPRKSPSNDVMPSLEVVPPRKSPSRPLRPESSIASTLEEIRKVNIIDVSSLEDHVENFFKSYAEYDTLRSSKMTKESHEKALSNAQRRLDGAKLAHEKLDGSMEKLQATLADVEKDLKALTYKKKKVTALINKYQEKLSKSQENVTITEGEIYTIEANNVMSNDEVGRLAKLEGAVEKSRQEIISFKLFP